MWLINMLALTLSFQATPLPPSTLPIALLSVAFDDKVPSRSMCMVACPRAGEAAAETMLLGPGEVACSLAEIKDIRQGGVVVRNRLTNREELLTLASAEGGGTAAPAVMGAPLAPPVLGTSPDSDEVTVSLPKASVDHYLFNLNDLLASALATPHVLDDGRGARVIDGFEIGEIRSGSVVEQLGLKNGDVILSVNGEALNDLAAIVRLAAQAQSMPEVRMSVRRQGRMMTFVFRTR